MFIKFNYFVSYNSFFEIFFHFFGDGTDYEANFRDLFKEDKYHLKKLEECEAKGIKLIQIFEDEWRDKQDIVKSRISSIFCFVISVKSTVELILYSAIS